jgi:DNA-binding CsgD family transcriptional regulator
MSDDRCGFPVKPVIRLKRVAANVGSAGIQPRGGKKIDAVNELDRLASEWYHQFATPDAIPELAKWLSDRFGEPDALATGRTAPAPPDWQRLASFLHHCRAVHALTAQDAGSNHSSHVARLLTDENGLILECDAMGVALLRDGRAIVLACGGLACTDQDQQLRLQAAYRETLTTGKPVNLLISQATGAGQRYSLSLERTRFNNGNITRQGVRCLIAPLDHRRTATARQLMELFGLSAAEARLARALCNGDSLDEYAQTQGVRLPTVRTQLRSIFVKTATERQAALVRLIAGIPAVRENG